MGLSEDQLSELRRVLHRHLIVLDAMLAAPEREVLDLHIPIAAQLRVLLCDSELPVLLTYARAKDIELHVWGPRPPGKGLHTDLLFHFSALVASWDAVPGAHEMSIDDYLDTAVGVVSLPGAHGKGEGRGYSPRQLIKWVANKEGGTHFAFDKPATLRVLKESKFQSGDTTVDAFQVKHVIFGIADWTHAALAHVLNLAA